MAIVRAAYVLDKTAQLITQRSEDLILVFHRL